jgi:hypothetical protein
MQRLGSNEKAAMARDPLPFLPINRASILTPSSSRETLVPARGNYGNFQKLPYELRRQIL